MKNFLFLKLILFSYILLAQSNPYKFSHEIKTYIDTAQVSWKYQIAAAEFSFVNQYNNVLESWDISTGNRAYKFHPEDSIYWHSAQQVSAKDFILNQAKNEEILIFNEAHHVGRHRLFVKSLLKDLYAQGYRHLGLEALYTKEIKDRKFAIQTDGFYTNEPEFGNLIYEALQLGFQVFGYEAEENANGKEREIQQAKNIQNYLHENPNGKTIILCGFDHVQEGPNRSWEKAMAGRLKEYTGIDPYTINQVSITEKFNPELNHYFLQHNQFDEVFVLLNSEKIPFNGFSEPKQTDLVIIHPQTKWTENQPNWKVDSKKKVSISEDKIKNFQFPIQILAFRQGEFKQNGVPADVLEITSSETPLDLFLDPNDYEIIIRNSSSQVLNQFELRLK